MPVGHFLGGIAALIYDAPTQTCLILQRASHRDAGAGMWECVTGRVDQGESFEQALHREVAEEIGCRVRVDFLIATTHFYRGPATPENELLGVMYACTLLDPEAFHIGPEHDQFRWVTRQEAEALLGPENWLARLSARAGYLRANTPPEMAGYFHELGFEI